MAKRKKPAKKHHHRHHRRGRVGGMGHFNLMDTLQGGLGLVLGATAGTMTQKYVHAIPQKLLGAGQLVLGMMATQQHNKILSAAGWGFAGAGATALAHDTGILRGIDDMISGLGMDDTLSGAEEIDYRANGLPNDMMIAGMPNESTLAVPESQAPMNTSMDADAPMYYVPTMGY